MQNSVAVCSVHCERDLLNEQDLLLKGQLAQCGVQGLAIHIFHRDIGLALKLTDLVDLADVYGDTDKSNHHAKLRRWKILGWLLGR